MNDASLMAGTSYTVLCAVDGEAGATVKRAPGKHWGMAGILRPYRSRLSGRITGLVYELVWHIHQSQLARKHILSVGALNTNPYALILQAENEADQGRAALAQALLDRAYALFDRQAAFSPVPSQVAAWVIGTYE
jgi:hypothetical protein